MKQISLKSKDIKELIVAGFGQLMSAEGFVYKKADNEFRKTIDNYTYIVNILLTSWSNSYSINVRIWISQKQIEDILESVLGKQPHKLTFSQAMIERIYYSQDGRINGKGDSLGIWLTEDKDIHFAIETLRIYYDTIAKPYFSKFSTLKAFDNYLNNPPFDYSPAYVGGSTGYRCMKGLIAAKLINNPNYKELTAFYDSMIKEADADSAIEYKKVKSFLAH